MRAAVIDHDAPGHVAIKEVDRPVLAPNQALIKVAAVSLNLGEVRMAQSAQPGALIGWDLAGTVEEAAVDGSGPAVGTRVVGFMGRGAWAELAAVATNSLAALPDNVAYTQAATLPVAGLTALYALEKQTGLLGRRALVTGASGGVGLFACQLAKLMGAEVVGVIRREHNRELVHSNGAHLVVLSEDGSAACEYAPYRVIVELVGGVVLGNALSLLAKDGICVSIAASAGATTTIDISHFYAAGRTSLYGFLLFNELGKEPASEGLARLAALVSEGRLKTQVTVEESWSKAGEVARDLLDRKISGKAVLRVE